MSELGEAISNLDQVLDLYGPQLGLSDGTITAFDLASSGAVAWANNQPVALQVAAAGVAAVAVASIGEEALAAGAMMVVGEEAMLGSSSLIDSEM
jgi:hypothetical protein